MTILSGIPVLNCHSIDDTLRFYQQLLHFVVVKKRELDGRLSWVHIMHGDTTLMLQTADVKKPDSIASINTNIALYFFVDNLSDLKHLIRAKGCSSSEVVSTNYHMQEFTLLDPEGNKLIIGQKS